MPRKRNPNNNYFNEAVEQAVCAYLNSTDELERNKHFRIIYPALCKIAEVWYHKLKFSYSDDDIEDVMAGCVAHLVEKMDKFQCSRGTKAFSYYTVTAKYYYMLLSNKNYKYFQKNIPISSMPEQWDVENEESRKDKQNENAKLLFDFVKYCEHNFENIFHKKQKPYARMVLDVMNNFDDVDDFRRRKFLQHIFIKNGVKEKEKTHITKVMNQMTSQLVLFRERWYEDDGDMELITKNYLSDKEKEIIRDTIQIGVKNNGATALARDFGVSPDLIIDYAKSLHT